MFSICSRMEYEFCKNAQIMHACVMEQVPTARCNHDAVGCACCGLPACSIAPVWIWLFGRRARRCGGGSCAGAPGCSDRDPRGRSEIRRLYIFASSRTGRAPPAAPSWRRLGSPPGSATRKPVFCCDLHRFPIIYHAPFCIMK